jgi:ferric-dicitrate binding protein FerR (iron transport regulator)
MTQSTPPDERAADAVECFLCLNDPDADPRVRARWMAWIGECEENQSAYHAVRETWKRPIRSDVWHSHADIVNDSHSAEGPVPAGSDRLRRRGGAESRRSWTTLLLISVAGVLLVAVIGVGLGQYRRPADTPSANILNYIGDIKQLFHR